MVDEGTTMAHLKGLLDQFAHAMFGAGRADALPPGLLPVHGAVGRLRHPVRRLRRGGCPACSRTGWMTILGAGMVHPVVLRYGGIDPERYQGFAFGMGVERIANLRHARRRPAPVHGERPALPRSVPMRSPAVLAARVRRGRPDAGAARRAADPARHGGQGHRALGRRLAERRRRAAADASRSTRAPIACA